MMMEKYINEYGKECWRGLDLLSPFTAEMFHEVDMSRFRDDTDCQWALHTNLGSITVLDRLTGFSGYVRDTETGYRDPEGKFWLASGMQDVRESGAKTIGAAIGWIKKRANTCAPTN